MKLECLKENLTNSLNTVGKIAGKNLQLSVLNYVILSAQDGSIKLKATNLDLGIEMEIPAKVNEEGVVAIPAATMQNFISSIYDSHTINMELKDDSVTVYTAENKAVIKTHPHDDFPTIPEVEDGAETRIPSEELLKGLKSVWYSASNSTVKPELASVNMYGYDQKVFFVATDSFRLAEKSIPIKKMDNFDSVLIPIKNIPEIMRVLEADEGLVDVKMSNNQISFSTKNIYLTSRLVEGSFPDYKQIIPEDYVTEVTLLKQDLVNAMKTTNVFLDKFNQVNFKAEPSQKKFTISAKNTEVGENTTSINASLSGEDVDINFNHKYVTDCFQSINDDSLIMYFTGSGKPVIIKGVSDNSFRYLVMPMSK